MSQEEFNNYSLSLKSDQQDQYIEFNNNFASIVSDEQLQYNLQQINENNICLDQIGIACNETDSFKLNPNILQYYQHGMKYLITQIDKLIESQPHFFYDSINNNSFKQVQDFYSNNDHIVYIDYGSEILISAYAKLVETAHQEFDQALTIYKQTLLIFILSVGMMGLLIISMLGRLLLNMQQDSISTCQSSLLLISPKRYLNQNIAQLTQKKR